MADEFSFTDSEDERVDEGVVEDIPSQVLDHSVLEQIAAINCSSFSSKDNLPFEPENRFRNLKSLPTASAAGARFPPSKSKSFTPRSDADSVCFDSDLKNYFDKPSPFPAILNNFPKNIQMREIETEIGDDRGEDDRGEDDRSWEGLGEDFWGR
ncbi:hypothetical protein Hanom_Chr02g00166551 [Helianthus anomalus]